MRHLIILCTISCLLFSLTGCGKKQKKEQGPIRVKSDLTDAERVENLHQIGVIAGTTGKFDLAIKQFKEVLKINPRHVGAIHDMGLAYARKGQIRQAIEMFQRAVSINPRFAEGYYNLSASYYRLGQQDMGLDYLERCLELNPNHAKALLTKASLSEQRGDLRSASQILAHFLKFDASNTKVRARLGNLYFQQGLDENAKIELLKAVKRLQTAQVLYPLGVIFHRQGEFHKAQKFYEGVLDKDPNHVEALVSMGEILERTGEFHRALVHYERAYGLESHNEYIRSKVQKLRNMR